MIIIHVHNVWAILHVHVYQLIVIFITGSITVHVYMQFYMYSFNDIHYSLLGDEVSITGSEETSLHHIPWGGGA